jgi:hypothetical protein
MNKGVQSNNFILFFIPIILVWWASQYKDFPSPLVIKQLGKRLKGQ